MPLKVIMNLQYQTGNQYKAIVKLQPKKVLGEIAIGLG